MALKSNFAALLILLSIGVHAETIVTNNGDHFEDARVTAVTPATITIFHRVGVATISLADVPADLQKRYGYDLAKAGAWLRQEAEQQQQQAIATEKQRQEAAAAAYQAKQDRKQKEAEIQNWLAKMHSLTNAVYDPATRQWYASPEEGRAAREQALKDALEAKRDQRHRPRRPLSPTPQSLTFAPLDCR